MIDKLASVTADVVADLFGETVSPVFTRTDEIHGDFATNIAMQLAPRLGKNPREVAEALTEKLKTNEELRSVEVAGPGFINIRFKSSALAEVLANELPTNPVNEFGASGIGTGKTVVCEFPSPNMAKPFSVGHIRAALQGWSIYKLMSKMGYTVITDNHLGDSGTPFGKWVVGFLNYSSDAALAENGIQELSRIYIKITSEMKREAAEGIENLSNDVQLWLKKLETGDPEAVGYSIKFNKISLNHMHDVMNRLGIATEYEMGESQFVSRGQELTDELLNKGIAQESEGAVIVTLDEYGIDTPIMLRKANGAALYATTDLATIEYREKTWNPEKVFIHTGQEQAFYFRQLSALAQKAGYKNSIQHLWHGLVDQISEEGTREKMSSRKGVILLSDLLDEAEKRAAENMPTIKIEDSKKVALAAIKFTDFTAERKNGVLFDWESMFNVHGFSGPAVQYAAVRIKSIIKKSEIDSFSPDLDYEWEEEHALLIATLSYPQLLLTLHDSYELHKLAAYLYELARKLNRYYEKTSVLKADPIIKASRLWLLSAVGGVLESGLDILGIQIPEEM